MVALVLNSRAFNDYIKLSIIFLRLVRVSRVSWYRSLIEVIRIIRDVLIFVQHLRTTDTREYFVARHRFEDGNFPSEKRTSSSSSPFETHSRSRRISQARRRSVRHDFSRWFAHKRFRFRFRFIPNSITQHRGPLSIYENAGTSFPPPRRRWKRRCFSR